MSQSVNTTQGETELAPCRHGKAARVCHDEPPTKWAVASSCKECGQTEWLSSREEAISAWNTRPQAASPAVVTEAIDRLLLHTTAWPERYPEQMADDIKLVLRALDAAEKQVASHEIGIKASLTAALTRPALQAAKGTPGIDDAPDLVRQWQEESHEWFKRDIQEIVEDFAKWMLERGTKSEPASGDDLQHRLRMIVAHASGGALHEGEYLDWSINDICVAISRHKNEIWEQAQQSAFAKIGLLVAALREELEHFVDIVDGTEQTGFDPHVEQMLMDAADKARALLSAERSGGDA